LEALLLGGGRVERSEKGRESEGRGREEGEGEGRGGE